MDQVTVAERGAAAAEVDQTLNMKTKPSLSVNASSKKKAGSGPSSPDRTPSGVTKDVALKVIPKKKVKGNEASVWGEMEVLKGLDHPNIVSIFIYGSTLVFIFSTRSNFMNGLNPDPNIISHLNLQLAVNSLRESYRRENSRSKMLLQ